MLLSTPPDKTTSTSSLGSNALFPLPLLLDSSARHVSMVSRTAASSKALASAATTTACSSSCSRLAAELEES